MAQAVACNDHCSIPRRLNLSRPALPSSRCWKSPRRIGFRVRAADEAEECNEEACAPEKEVGKVSMEWAVEERTKVLGTFPPTTKQRWTGYVEKDTAGQTSIYSVEILAEVGISSSLEEEILTRIKGSTTPPETNKDSTSKDSYASDGEQLFEREIEEDEEELQHDLSKGNCAYESLIEQWFQEYVKD